jgi:hypothetical protein
MPLFKTTIETLKFVVLMGIIGQITHLAGRLGYLTKPVSLCLLSLVIFYLVFSVIKNRKLYRQIKLSSFDRFFLIVIVGALSLYSLSLFVPDTAFDAIWYHLPLAQIYAATGTIAKVRELLYSTMPRQADLYFTLAISASGLLQAAKLISFSFTLIYLWLVYLLSRHFLSLSQSLLTTAIITSFTVIAWASTSAYVDLPRATFELSALLSLLLWHRRHPKLISGSQQIHPAKSDKFRNQSKMTRIKSNLASYLLPHTSLILAAIFSGLALSVKLQSLHFLTATTVFILVQSSIDRHPELVSGSTLKKIFYALLPLTSSLLLSLAIASPWLYANHLESGHPLYPTNTLSIHSDILHFSGAINWPEWFTRQTLRLPLIFYYAVFQGFSYTTPLVLILSPFLLLGLFKIKKRYLPYILFSVCYLLLWWYSPPPDTRYALSLWPLLIIFALKSAFSLPSHFQSLKSSVVIVCILGILFNLATRLPSAYAHIRVISGQISRQEYLNTHTTDFNRDLIEKLYSGYWQTYRYP